VEMPAMRCDMDERRTLGRRGIEVNALACIAFRLLQEE